LVFVRGFVFIVFIVLVLVRGFVRFVLAIVGSSDPYRLGFRQQ
jgi:hypothetical protein